MSETTRCTGIHCDGCEAGRRHYAATGCLVPGCTDDHTPTSGAPR